MPGKKATPTTYRKKTAKKASSPIKAAPRGSSVTLREDPLLYGAKQPRFIDLFCGIGGFRIAFEKQGAKCVFSSDYDKFSQQSYEANYGEKPHGDIHSVAVADIIAHHRPAAFVLENVKNLQSHDQGNTFRVIYETLTKHLRYTFASYLWSSPSSS